MGKELGKMGKEVEEEVGGGREEGAGRWGGSGPEGGGERQQKTLIL